MEDFLGYAMGDREFAEWCQEINRLAVRFVSVTFFEIEANFDVAGAYYEGRTPIYVVRHCIVPEIVCDDGYDFVEDVVADNIMWGVIL